jgi:predicted ATPase
MEKTMDDVRQQEEVLEMKAPTTLILGEEGSADHEDVAVLAGDAFGTF